MCTTCPYVPTLTSRRTLMPRAHSKAINSWRFGPGDGTLHLHIFFSFKHKMAQAPQRYEPNMSTSVATRMNVCSYLLMEHPKSKFWREAFQMFVGKGGG